MHDRIPSRRQENPMTAAPNTFRFKDPTTAILAIDFGTSNSLVAAADAQSFSAPLPLDHEAEDPTVFRSVLFFPHGDLCFYGQKAIREYTESQAHGRLVRSV